MSNKQLITIGDYNGTPIHIRQSDRYYNATEMCKANGVEWKSYWRTAKDSEFIRLLEVQNCTSKPLVIVGKGRSHTWVERDVAWDLAMWISAAFRIWLIRQGQAIEDGRQVAHREHAELTAEQHLGRFLSHVNGKLEQHDERLNLNSQDIETLFSLCSSPKSKPRKHEAEVRDRWASRWGDAITEYRTKYCTIDIYVPTTWVIEVKRENEWKGAVGQVLQAQRVDRDACMMLILFTARNRDPYQPSHRLDIARQLNDQSIVVYWDDEPDTNYNAIVERRGRNLTLPLY